MNHWPFIAAAYGVTLAGLGVALLHSWRVMRRTEARADDIVGTK